MKFLKKESDKMTTQSKSTDKLIALNDLVKSIFESVPEEQRNKVKVIQLDWKSIPYAVETMVVPTLNIEFTDSTSINEPK